MGENELSRSLQDRVAARKDAKRRAPGEGDGYSPGWEP